MRPFDFPCQIELPGRRNGDSQPESHVDRRLSEEVRAFPRTDSVSNTVDGLPALVMTSFVHPMKLFRENESRFLTDLPGNRSLVNERTEQADNLFYLF